jgi:uncharacterized OB-fold protein
MAETTWKLEFPYRRSVGPVIGAFLSGLRDGKVVGIRTGDGRVICPPLEYDPDTGDALDPNDIVELSDTGTVTDSAYVANASAKQPLGGSPFSWALIKIDGADTALLHAVDGDVQRGAKVRARWRDERKGHVTDIECFEVVS